MALLVLRRGLRVRRRQRAGLVVAKRSRIVGGDGLLILIVNVVVVGVAGRRVGIG